MPTLTPAQIAQADQIEADALDRIAHLLKATADHRSYHPSCDGLGQEAATGLQMLSPATCLAMLTVALRLLADQGHVEQAFTDVPA